MSGLADTSHIRVDQDGLLALLRREYGFGGQLKRLASEKDETFLLQTAEKDFIVKVSGGPEARQLVDLQLRAVDHVAGLTSLPVPSVIRTAGGRTDLVLATDDRARRVVHVIEFLGGRAVHEQCPTRSQSWRIGSAHGQLLRALAPFRHPGENRLLIWDLAELPALAGLVETVSDVRRARLAHEVMKAFRATIVPRIPLFRAQVVHGDFSSHNVLVDPGSEAYVTGIVDFGDVHRGAVVFDVAIALANVIDHRMSDPWERPASHLAGLLSENTLSGAEIAVLPLAVAARSLQRVLIAEWRARRHPDRAAYVLEHARDDWDNAEAAFTSASTASTRLRQIGETASARTEPPR